MRSTKGANTTRSEVAYAVAGGCVSDCGVSAATTTLTGARMVASLTKRLIEMGGVHRAPHC